jgi:hypothetical protein
MYTVWCLSSAMSSLRQFCQGISRSWHQTSRRMGFVRHALVNIDLQYKRLILHDTVFSAEKYRYSVQSIGRNSGDPSYNPACQEPRPRRSQSIYQALPTHAYAPYPGQEARGMVPRLALRETRKISLQRECSLDRVVFEARYSLLLIPPTLEEYAVSCADAIRAREGQVQCTPRRPHPRQSQPLLRWKGRGMEAWCSLNSGRKRLV